MGTEGGFEEFSFYNLIPFFNKGVQIVLAARYAHYTPLGRIEKHQEGKLVQLLDLGEHGIEAEVAWSEGVVTYGQNVLLPEEIVEIYNPEVDDGDLRVFDSIDDLFYLVTGLEFKPLKGQLVLDLTY